MSVAVIFCSATKVVVAGSTPHVVSMTEFRMATVEASCHRVSCIIPVKSVIRLLRR